MILWKLFTQCTVIVRGKCKAKGLQNIIFFLFWKTKKTTHALFSLIEIAAVISVHRHNIRYLFYLFFFNCLLFWILIFVLFWSIIVMGRLIAYIFFIMYLTFYFAIFNECKPFLFCFCIFFFFAKEKRKLACVRFTDLHNWWWYNWFIEFFFSVFIRFVHSLRQQISRKAK